MANAQIVSILVVVIGPNRSADGREGPAYDPRLNLQQHHVRP